MWQACGRANSEELMGGGAEHLIYSRKVGTRGNIDGLAEHRVTDAYCRTTESYQRSD